MIKVFQTTNDFEGFAEGGMKSGNLYYVIEDKSVHFTTNNIDGTSRNYDIGVGDDIVPEGNIDLTVNGNYDVSSYATAYVNVASGGDNADFINLIERDVTTINIPSGTTSIGSSAFRDCTSLTSITIPDSVTYIDNYAFYGCTGLTSITIPSDVTSIGNFTFMNCKGLTSVTIPDSVTSIGNSVFSGCTGLTSAVIGNSVTIFGTSIFYNCKSLTSVTINCNVPNQFLKSNTAITNVTIGSDVTSIGDYAFQLCTSLASVTVLATTPPTLGTTVFDDNASGRKIYVPAASVEAYKAAWSTYAADIEAIPSN